MQRLIKIVSSFTEMYLAKRQGRAILTCAKKEYERALNR
jgi:hypothetical protein